MNARIIASRTLSRSFICSSILPPDQYSFSDEDRISYSFGKSSIEILAARLGKTTEPVEAVVFPDYGTVEKLIKELDPKKYQLIPVGGASNVTGDLSYSKGKKEVYEAFHSLIILLS